MTCEEKILMVELLLRDIRYNWAYYVKERVGYTKELCNELGGDFLILAKKCDEFESSSEVDGRCFRKSFPYGYENMENIHNLRHTIEDKSENFRKNALLYLTYPEYAFDDYLDKESET